MSKKKDVILAIYEHCKKKNSYVFHNDIVKEFSKKIGLGNPFDVTKLDTSSKIPQELVEKNICIVHLGSGNHQFINAFDKVFHKFEPIEKTIDWNYQRSILNLSNSSESNILSVANNQRILHQFVFGEDTEFNNVEIIKRPKTYFPHRTKADLTYKLGDLATLNLKNIQIEIDLTIELKGKVAIFESKNGNPKDFSICQIYHPFLFYHNLNTSNQLVKGKISEIIGVYAVKSIKNGVVSIKLWSYTFNDPFDITSIKLLNSARYNLVEKPND